ncbi:hypothetical protein BHC47_09680 [Snodgrassella alvi]|uniref:HEAT repeat domain-containing protein n=1 Tax=Snodgrassella alvi TaxID=1196083 RepID=A0A2N9Y6N3_9NEIS|nr:hypothetical protein [Snodgrassella alvi]PIT64565.1 hypothetical protein BHC47_09680 [Snodgrassella alvi]PIT64746.1 hypothetical protein BHC56_11445 [Snodgrassella alvi]
MTIEPIYSKEWINVNEADTKVRVSQFYFRKTNDLFEQILWALNDDPAEQATALRFLRNECPSASELEVLAPVIINMAVNENTDNSILARQCLVNSAFNQDRTIRKKLTSMFDDFLKSENQYTYRRLAELLFFLDYKNLRKRLMEKCKNSKDKDIVNIYTEFTEKYDF